MQLDELHLPISIRDSSLYVMNNANHVKINETALSKIAQKVKERYERGFDNVEDAFGSTDRLDDDINLVFFETAANFCFWAQDSKDKWKFDFEGQQQGGWYGLRSTFAAALKNNIPVYDAKFMSTLTLSKAAELFRGVNGTQIPLLEHRVNNIVEAANFLINEHNGSAHEFVKSCGYDAVKIATAITQALVSYRDGAWYKNRWIWTLKRAQILPNDLAMLTQKYPEFVIKNTNQLTVFADYRLPQILEHYGVLEYSDALEKIIGSKQILPAGSDPEVEIRAATIVACDELAKHCDMAINDVDVSLWLISQDMRDNTNLRPHHLTVSIYY
jgi:hypothetical protein